jgi:hypothetical protein
MITFGRELANISLASRNGEFPDNNEINSLTATLRGILLNAAKCSAGKRYFDFTPTTVNPPFYNRVVNEYKQIELYFEMRNVYLSNIRNEYIIRFYW